jgi:hypothetical protein
MHSFPGEENSNQRHDLGGHVFENHAYHLRAVQGEGREVLLIKGNF